MSTKKVGDRVVTVARADRAQCAGYLLYDTVVYEVTLRKRDGAMVYRRVYAVGQETSGKGVTGPMVTRAKQYAEEKGLEYLPGVRQFQMV